MCANYIPVSSSDRLLTYFGVERDKDGPTVDAWPKDVAPFIRLAEPGSGNRMIVDDGIFGLVPPHFAELAKGEWFKHNARSETVARLPSFGDSWAQGLRCIVPAEAIYEPYWPPESARSERWMIHQEGDVPMGIAGIYRKWDRPDGTEVLTFSMLTVNADAHPVMNRFHRPGEEKRMVVILDPKDYGGWLTCTPAEARKYLKPWQGPLLAKAAPLERVPRAPKPTKPPAPVKTPKPTRPPPPVTGNLFD